MRKIGLLIAAMLLASCGGTTAEEPEPIGLVNTDGKSAATTTTAPQESGTTRAPTADTEAEPAATTTTAPSEMGSRTEPVPAGTPVRVGDWEVVVLAATANGTAAVIAENEFNDPPPEGHQFSLIEVAATYLGDTSEPMFAGLTFSAVGDSAVAYDYSSYCGVIPNDVSSFAEVFSGGTVQGNLCWPVTAEDAASLVLLVDPAFSFADERAFLEVPTDGEAFDPPQAASDGLDTSSWDIAALGSTVSIGNWDVTVLSATPDATAAVVAENPFNDPPVEGHQFYIVELEATYNGNESESLFAGLTFTTVGDTAVAYDYEASCGVIPEELDTFSEVFTGGAVSGNLCWSVAASDADGLLLIVDAAFSVDGERAFMSPR